MFCIQALRTERRGEGQEVWVSPGWLFWPPFSPSCLLTYSCNKLSGSEPGLSGEKGICAPQAVCFSTFVIYFFGFSPSFLVKYFLNNLSLVWTPEICRIGAKRVKGSRASGNLAWWASSCLSWICRKQLVEPGQR